MIAAQHDADGKVHAPHSHDDRPVPTTQMPIIAKRTKDGLLMLEWVQPVLDLPLPIPRPLMLQLTQQGFIVLEWRELHNEKLVCQEGVNKSYRGLNQRVFEMMACYYDLEAKVNGLMKERDDAVTECEILRGQLEDERKKVVGYQSNQLKKAK